MCIYVYVFSYNEENPATELNLRLQAEHMPIFNQNDEGKRTLTWAQTRNMPLTHRVSENQGDRILSGTES